MFRRTVYSFALGFVVFLLGVGLRTMLDTLDVGGFIAIVDDVVTAVFAGLLVFFYERHQHKAVLKHMSIIADMNHHVRNALQPIVYSPFLKEQAEQIRTIQESTRRIEWALKEVLPGEVMTGQPASSKSKSAA
jgi:hypothetical protein